MTMRSQQGAALIAAIFLITALAAMGAFLTRLLVMQSEETLNEWYSAQALYAAEAGVDWTIYSDAETGPGAANARSVLPGQAWFNTTRNSVTVAGRTLYTIVSVGSAGGDVNAPRAQRRIEVQYMQP
jgi:type II secretory pathway component PulK